MTDETKLVYVAGPLTTGDYLSNVRTAIETAEMVYRAGHTPFIPHTMTPEWDMIYPKEYDEWMDIDLDILKRCDLLVRIDGESPGAETEVAFAEKEGIPWMTASEFEAKFGGGGDV